MLFCREQPNCFHAQTVRRKINGKEDLALGSGSSQLRDFPDTSYFLRSEVLSYLATCEATGAQTLFYQKSNPRLLLMNQT